MWSEGRGGFSTPPARWKSRPAASSYSSFSERKPNHRSPPSSIKSDLFHLIHKVPAGDSPYVKAKHVQLIDKDPSKAISLFWAAINSGDRVDSALKDMAVVMKQLNRTDEAIEAIKSFRNLCPYESQESIDNLLVELYKRSGRIEEEIEMLECKLKRIEEGMVFGGKKMKTARSRGKKIQITVGQERSRILGNLAWAYLQLNNFENAEELYRKALVLEPDRNKQCNLAICLMHMNRIAEAKFILEDIIRAAASCRDGHMDDDSYAKSLERAIQMLTELDSGTSAPTPTELREGSNKSQRSFTLPVVNSDSKENAIPIFGCVSSSFMVDNKDKFLVHDKGNSKCGSYGAEDSHFNILKEGAGFERSPDFAHKEKENWLSRTGTHAGSSEKSSPIFVREALKVPFTEPRRVGHAEEEALQNYSGEDNSKPGHCRKKSWADMVEEEEQELLGAIIDHQEFKWNQLPVHEFKNSSQAPIEERVKAWDAEEEAPQNYSREENSRPGHCRKKSWADMVEEEQQELLGAIMDHREFKWNHHPVHEFKNSSQAPIEERVKAWDAEEEAPQNYSGEENSKPGHCRKKSWADMVEEEEEEEELLGAIMDHQEWNHHPVHEFKNSSQAPIEECVKAAWDGREEFLGENLNHYNIICSKPGSLNQTEYLSRNIESLNLKDDEEYIKYGNALSSRNPTVRRSLCFDQQQNLQPIEYSCSSPLPKKPLDMDANCCVLGDGSKSSSFEKNTKPLRRNRLQIFESITLFSESP